MINVQKRRQKKNGLLYCRMIRGSLPYLQRDFKKTNWQNQTGTFVAITDTVARESESLQFMWDQK